jgi:hypothetical protein
MGSLPVDLANEEPFKQSSDHLWPRIMHAHAAKAVAGSRLEIASDQQANNKQGEWKIMCPSALFTSFYFQFTNSIIE